MWLDDDVVDRRAPAGWVHFVTAREVCFLLLSGRVVELSLDHDLGNDTLFGRGPQVIDFLVDQHGQFDRDLWPRDGITLHTANSSGRDAVELVIQERAGKYYEVEKSYRWGTCPHFDFKSRPSAPGGAHHVD